MGRKKAIPFHVRRAVALRAGCPPGGSVTTTCFYCPAIGTVTWWTKGGGAPSAWVSFQDLELDHVTPEARGGQATAENIHLTCRRCNRSKGTNSAPKVLRG